MAVDTRLGSFVVRAATGSAAKAVILASSKLSDVSRSRALPIS